MDNKPIVRTTYFNPKTNLERQGNTANGESRVDQEQFAVPTAQLGGGLHDWGVASGLGVTATVGSPGVTIAPGVALDVAGRHISLAAGGFAEVNPNAQANVTSTLANVTAAGVAFDTSTVGAGDQYLTLEFRETFDDNAFNSSQLFHMLHTPWLRLTPAAQFANDGSRVVLARLGFDAAGNVISLTQDLRQQTGLPVGRARFWKAQATSNMPQHFTVDNQPAGEIRPRNAGGLTISADTTGLETLAGTENFVIDVAGGVFGRTNGPATLNLFGSQLKDTSGDNLVLSNPTRVSVDTPYLRVGAGFADLQSSGQNHVQMDVQDRVRLRQGVTQGAGIWLFQTAANADRAMIGMASDNQVGLFGNTGASWGLVMDTTTGNVGIGTQSPGFRLDVADRMRVRQGSAGDAGVWLFQTGPNADRAFLGMANDNQVGFWGSNGANWGLVMNTDNGLVGIGTQSPGFRLDVADRMRVRQGGAGTAGIWMFQTGVGDRAFVGMADNNRVGFWGNAGAGWGLTVDVGSGGVTINAVGANNTTGLDVTGTTNGLSAHTKASQNFAGLALPNMAGFFGGDVQVVGTLSKSAGTFFIDHPLDPENKFLRHAFVESPDMMNVYTGVVTTNENGEATVELPGYFDALNKDVRYQLTPIGQLALAAVVQEVKDCRFGIKTDKPNVQVSWTVTGVRQDVYANAHRVVVEEDKKDFERGHFLHPKLFKASITKHMWKAHVRKWGMQVPEIHEEESQA
ncbi:MAG TPA: hypothetical protein VH643_06400 [Gemmataceae bacterium]